jgi:cytochrome c553
MRISVSLTVLGFFAGSAAFAQGPEWAYQSVTEEIPAAHHYDPDMPRTVPGSSLSRTQPEIDDHWNPPDWFPDRHGPVPEVVAHGRGPEVRGCAACHGFTGMGHPESSQLAGYSVNYIINQMADYKNGSRKDRYWMNGFAEHISDEDVRAAAEYFSALEPLDWVVDVIEADVVPRTYIGDGRMRFVHPDGGTEPLGYKAIELPEDRELATARHPYSGFIAYVPEGSIARGQELVTTGGSGKTVPCMACHGIDLKGVGDIPAIAGSSPVYAIRQLNDFKNGDRAGNMAALMRPTVANLTTEDMVDIVAYLATLDP